MKSKLVIFDCDGVLIDSEILSHRVGSEELTRLGFPLTVARSIEIFSGVAYEDFPQVIEKEYGRSFSNNDFNLVVSKIEKHILTNIKAIAGMSQVVEHVGNRYKDKCTASNSWLGYLNNVLSLTGMSVYFSQDLVFSASMVKKGKPMPDLFLHAAERFQAKDTECIVIEDSLVGIRAAKAAKMSVIGFLGGTHAKNAWYRDSIAKAKPDMIANDANELLEILG